MDPNTDAKTLNLDGNNIGVHGAQVLAKELKDRSTLQVLWKLLSDKKPRSGKHNGHCQIREEGAKAFGEALKIKIDTPKSFT